MRVNKLHSSLSIAAIVILTAVASSIAQAQTNGSREAASSLFATAGNDLMPSFNLSRVVAGDGRVVNYDVERRSFNPVVPANSRVTLSAAALEVPTKRGVAENKLSAGQQLELFQVTSDDSRKSHRGDDDLRIQRSKWRIEFVPSRGLRMPYQN
jgi:hypothetical protein